MGGVVLQDQPAGAEPRDPEAARTGVPSVNRSAVPTRQLDPHVMIVSGVPALT